jgi:DNA-binding response OmpR family regulator
LSIAKAIVERMRGQIGFTSTAGAGTTFFFDLPRENPTPARKDTENGPGRLLLCLAVDQKTDDLEHFLENHGYPTRRASCPSEAEVILKEERISAVVVDPRWVQAETLAVLGAILRELELCELPVVGMSDRANDSDATAALGLSRVFWISPRDPEKSILATLHRAIAPGRGRLVRLFHVSGSPEADRMVQDVFRGLAHVIYADTLEKGWKCLRGDAFDLLLTDIHLSDGCALELVPLLTGLGKEKTPVIVLSDGQLPAKAAPVIDIHLIRSSTSPQQLLAAVQSLLQPLTVIPRTSAPELSKVSP